MDLKKTIIIKRSKLEQPLTRGIEMMMEEDGGRIMFLPDDCTVEYVGEDSKVVFEQQWIPVTERLPEEGERVLATHLGGLDPNRQVIEHIYENGKFTCGWDMDLDITSPTFGQRYMGGVVAWMPLPKPYEGGETE